MTAGPPRLSASLGCPLKNKGGALATAHAERGEAHLLVLLDQLVRQGQQQAAAGAAHGVAQGDGTAVDIELGGVQLADGVVQAQALRADLFTGEGLQAGQHLGGEGLVDLD